VRLAALLLTYVGTIVLQTRSLMHMLAPRDLACVLAGRLACEGDVPRMHGARLYNQVLTVNNVGIHCLPLQT